MARPTKSTTSVSYFRPPLTCCSSSSRNSRTCGARPNSELSLLLLMILSIMGFTRTAPPRGSVIMGLVQRSADVGESTYAVAADAGAAADEHVHLIHIRDRSAAHLL